MVAGGAPRATSSASSPPMLAHRPRDHRGPRSRSTSPWVVFGFLLYGVLALALLGRGRRSRAGAGEVLLDATIQRDAPTPCRPARSRAATLRCSLAPGSSAASSASRVPLTPPSGLGVASRAGGVGRDSCCCPPPPATLLRRLPPARRRTHRRTLRPGSGRRRDRRTGPRPAGQTQPRIRRGALPLLELELVGQRAEQLRVGRAVRASGCRPWR